MKAFKWGCSPLVAGRCSEWSPPLALAASLSGRTPRPQTGLLKPQMMKIITVIRSSCRGNLFWKTPSWVRASLPTASGESQRGRGGRKEGKKRRGWGERPPNPPNVTPVSPSPTSCHLQNALGFIFLIDTSLSHSISIFRLSFSLHHSLTSLPAPSSSPHLGLSVPPPVFPRCFSLSVVPPPPPDPPSPNPVSDTTPEPFCTRYLRWLIRHWAASRRCPCVPRTRSSPFSWRWRERFGPEKVSDEFLDRSQI